MGEDLKKEILESSDKIISLSSRIALIGGGLWFLMYAYFIVKDFPRSIEISLLYSIFAVSIILVFFIVYPLMFYLYIRIIEENNSEEKNDSKIKHLIKHLLQKIKDRDIQYLFRKFLYFLFANLLLIAYLFINFCLSMILLIRGDFSIFDIFGYKEYAFPFFIIFFIIFHGFIFILLEIFLKHKEDKNALLYLIIIPILIIIAYAGFFLTAPFQLLKIGYFEANLILEEKYIEKSGLKTYLEKCQPECLNKSSNDNYCKFFITCSEKCQTECLDELFKDTQNNNYCRTFKFFIFLRTSSEYIVGCSKNSDVRIHIPSDKVIAIDYNDKTLTPQQNKQ